MGSATAGGVAFQQTCGSLLDDKGGTQEEAAWQLQGELVMIASSLENLKEQQAKNTANLGTTTASPEKVPKEERKKKPSAKKASQDQSQRSLEQKGQILAAASPRSLEKSRIITEMELAAEGETNNSLGSKDLQNLSLRILLTLSLTKSG